MPVFRLPFSIRPIFAPNLFLRPPVPFLAVATSAELESAREEGRNITLQLEDGRKYRVAVGATLVALPNAVGEAIQIEWEQDENGKLMATSYSHLKFTPRPASIGSPAGGTVTIGRPVEASYAHPTNERDSPRVTGYPE